MLNCDYFQTSNFLLLLTKVFYFGKDKLQFQEPLLQMKIQFISRVWFNFSSCFILNFHNCHYKNRRKWSCILVHIVCDLRINSPIMVTWCIGIMNTFVKTGPFSKSNRYFLLIFHNKKRSAHVWMSNVGKANGKRKRWVQWNTCNTSTRNIRGFNLYKENITSVYWRECFISAHETF